MEEIAILHWCDWHLVMEDTKEPATIKRVIVLDGTEATLDMCGACDIAAVTPLAQVLGAIGRRAKPVKPKPEKKPRPGRQVDVLCVKCDSWMDIRNRTKHADGVHEGLDAGRLEWAFTEDIELVVSCSCGLQFPTEHGRIMHIRKTPEGVHVPMPGTQEPRRRRREE